MSGVVWVLQGLLALAMLGSGLAKSFMSKARMLQTGQSGVAHLDLPAIRLIGVSELAGGVGIILPWWTGVWPLLTPVAALCFAVVMGLAFGVHTRLMRQAVSAERARREARNRITNLGLLVASLLVVVVRGLELVW